MSPSGPALTMHDILHPTQSGGVDGFPNAPAGWSLAEAEKTAMAVGVKLSEEHLEVIRVLQGCYAEDQNPPIRRLCDALAAVFKSRGGRKLLQKLYPGGPVSQGCQIAGLVPPAGTVSGAGGTVQ